MAKINSFRELDVWQLSMDLVVDCYRVTDAFPGHEIFGLRREARRSAVSIPSNLAEGHNRHAEAAYLNHVNIACGSQAELDTQIEIALRLGYLGNPEVRNLSDKLARVGQMLHGLQRSLAHKRASGQ
jgi:four helix bundle protein